MLCCHTAVQEYYFTSCTYLSSKVYCLKFCPDVVVIMLWPCTVAIFQHNSYWSPKRLHITKTVLLMNVSVVRINWDKAKLTFVKVLLGRSILPTVQHKLQPILKQSFDAAPPKMEVNSGVVWYSKLTFVNVNTLTIHQVSNSNLNSLNPTSWVRFWNKPFDFSHISKHPFVFYLLSWSIKNLESNFETMLLSWFGKRKMEADKLP